jgi:hypothetical protein
MLEQAMPQPPQWALLVRVWVSQPLVWMPSQLPKPAMQEVMEHAPAEQTEVALESVHALPHAPQLVALLRRSVSQPLLAAPSQLPKPA